MNLPKQFYYKKNRLQQLKGFYYTVQTGSPSQAAKHMCLGQSTVTMQIQSLERDLDTVLFKRRRGNFQLTDDGKLLFDIAVPLIQGIDGLYEQFYVRKISIDLKEVNIAAHHIAISYLLPEYLLEFKTKFPDVKINIKNISPGDALERLKEEKIDMMIYPTTKVPEECFFKPSFQYDPILLMRKDHPLASPDIEIILEKVAKYDVVRIDPQLITIPFFEEVLKQFNIGSNITFENGSWEMLKHFVIAKIGLAIISNVCVEKDHPILIGRSLRKYFPQIEYGVMVKKGKFINDTARSFINIVDSSYFA